MMKLLLSLLFLPIFVFSVSANAAEKCTVTIGEKELKADTHVIVVPEKPTPSERFAAEELCGFLSELTEEKLEIINEGQEQDSGLTDKNWISVGKTKCSVEAAGKIGYSALGPDGIRIKSVEDNLVLTGNKRGVLYSCYSFLQYGLGYRWYTIDCTVRPEGESISVKGLDITYVPAIKGREVYYDKSLNADWAARNRCSGFHGGKLGEKRGGKTQSGGAHSMAWRYMQPDKYFDKHPEYYALIDGKRDRHGQPCWSNPAVADMVIEQVMATPRSRYEEMAYINISQMDNRNYCQCEKCAALDKKGESQAASMLYAINNIARRLKNYCPNTLITTLAYQHTQKPPKGMEVEDNVMIMLCDIDASFAQPLDSDQNKKFRDDLNGWCKKTDKIFIWDYQACFPFQFQPFPNYRVIAPNIRYWIRNGIDYVFEEGYHGSRGGELPELKMWLTAQLLWNPDQDDSALIDQFLNDYYGPAGPIIREYVDLMENSSRKTKTFLRCFFSHREVPFLTKKVIFKAETIFDRAIKAAANDPVYLKRTKIASTPVPYMKIRIMADQMGKMKAKGKEISEKQRQEYLDELKLLKELTELDDVAKIRLCGGGVYKDEPNKVDEWLEYMEKICE